MSSLMSLELTEVERRLRGVVDAELAIGVVRAWMAELSTEALYDVLRCVLERPPPPETTFDPLLEAFHLAFGAEGPSAAEWEEALPYERRCELYARAAEHHDDALLALLRTPTAARAPQSSALRLPREIADIPLGRRRSLAKGGERRLLEQLALDPDATVIRNLLQNPRTRESDVLKLASRRPVSVQALREISVCMRWSRRAAVRVALARNPYAPVPLALQMQNGLRITELREISEDGTLHADVRQHAARLLERRALDQRDRGSTPSE